MFWQRIKLTGYLFIHRKGQLPQPNAKIRVCAYICIKLAQPASQCAGRHFEWRLMSQYVEIHLKNRFDVRIQVLVSKVQVQVVFLVAWPFLHQGGPRKVKIWHINMTFPTMLIQLRFFGFQLWYYEILFLALQSYLCLLISLWAFVYFLCWLSTADSFSITEMLSRFE